MSLPTATGEQHGQTKKRSIVSAGVPGCFSDFITISDAVHVANPNKFCEGVSKGCIVMLWLQ